jgi:general secretion pathway protein L
MSGTTFSSLRHPIAKARELIQAFGSWWMKGFLDLFPQRVADWLVDDGGRALVLALDAEAIALHLKAGRSRLLASSRVSGTDDTPHLIDAFLRSNRLNRAKVSVGVSLPEELIFRRSFALPLVARGALDAVALHDLLAKTPFQLDDIHHAHRVDRAGDKLVVWQCVVRRAHVAAAAESVGLEPEEVDFIELPSGGQDGGPFRIAAKRSSFVKRGRWLQGTGLALATTALLLAGTALGMRYHHQQVLLDRLQSEVADSTVKARSVQDVIDKLHQEQAILQRLRAKGHEPGLLDIWEEASRVLPVHTWLSELRLLEASEGRQVVITGFSAAAATLVGLLDRSAVFGEASLVGPIAVDPAEGKERFIIQARLKLPAPPRAVSR